MIRNVIKYLIMGTKHDLDGFFAEAQERGFLEFISLSPQKQVETPETVHSITQAIKILKKLPSKEPYENGADIDLALQLSEKVLELQQDIQKLQEEKRVLEVEKARVAPFGDFSLSDIHIIEKRGNRKVQFFCRKTSSAEEGDLPDEAIYVSTDYDLDYFISISSQAIAPAGMIEMRIDAPLGELQNRLDFVKNSIERFEGELKELAVYLLFLERILVEQLNQHALTCAKKEVIYPLENSLFFVEAWVPENQIKELEQLAHPFQIYLEQLPINPEEKVPTYLDNSETGKIGEDLIKIYDVPATTDKDPSTWVLIFFTLFFAVIVGDGGYGLIFLALAFYLKYKFPKIEGLQKRMVKLFFILSTACVAWGVLTCSYFGLKIAPSSPLSKISLMHALIEKKANYHLIAKDDVYDTWVQKFPSISSASSGEQMIEIASIKKKNVISYPIVDEFAGNITLEFTIILGILHVTLGFLRYLRRNIAGLGWICFMIGGYLFIPSILNATTILEFMGVISKPVAAALGQQCLYGGLSFALVSAVIQHRLKGLGEIANMVQVFADVLSYLRLYALSLAGAIMASTFNQEGSALGLFVGFIVILAGHVVNMQLALMGGVIHGLRLNFLEWYHYCFDGGGRLFKPLKKLKLKG